MESKRVKDWRWISKKDREDRYNTILKLKNQGLTNKQIGMRLGVHGNRVGQILKENAEANLLASRGIDK